jgi:hypothetical protein
MEADVGYDGTIFGEYLHAKNFQALDEGFASVGGRRR